MIRRSDVRGVVNDAIDKLIREYREDTTDGLDRAGWHNFFEGNKIGTTGSALPLLFLSDTCARFDKSDKVLGSLADMLKTDDRDQAAWATLSVPGVESVEGTVFSAKALTRLGDSNQKEIGLRAFAWLMSIQNDDGGWGSNDRRDASSRTNLTCNVAAYINEVEDSACRENLIKGLTWIYNAQNADGSWGVTASAPGELFYTAKALHVLFCCQCVELKESVITKGVDYLRSNLAHGFERFCIEIYDIPVPDGYNRITLKHDCLAQLLALFAVSYNWWSQSEIYKCLTRAVLWHKGEGFATGGSDPRESIWSVIPIAHSIYLIERNCLPAHCDGWNLIFGDFLVGASSPTRFPTLQYLAAKTITTFGRRYRKVIFSILSLMSIVVIIAVALFLQVGFESILFGLIVPIVLFIFGRV